jgi:hypothetical protein
MTENKTDAKHPFGKPQPWLDPAFVKEFEEDD